MNKVFIYLMIFLLLAGCGKDEILDTMRLEIDHIIPYEDIIDSQNGHTAYFKLADSGQTLGYSSNPGEDSDYTSLPSMSFTDNVNGTITDNITGLVWTKCTMITGSAMDATANCTGSPVKYDWQGAVDACEDLSFGGRDDWKLPTYSELLTIVDFGKVGANAPAIDTTYFPNTRYANYFDQEMIDLLSYISVPGNLALLDLYWTSTQWTSWGISVVVSFDDGYNNAQDQKTVSNYVRCVANTK
jgi:hypothetical protein